MRARPPSWSANTDAAAPDGAGTRPPGSGKYTFFGRYPHGQKGNAELRRNDAQLAACTDEHVTIRTVSCILYENTILFKTDRNFQKTKELLRTKANVALAKYSINIEGAAECKGLVVDEPGRRFEKLYKQYLDGSYGAYSHTDTEILFEITPRRIGVWDTDENNYAFQLYIDCEARTAVKEWYDEK